MTSPTLDRVLDVVLRVDRALDIKFISEPGRHWLGGNALAVGPTNLLELLHPDDTGPLLGAMERELESFACDLRVIRAGRECWTHVRTYQLAGVHQYVVCILDISSWKTDDAALHHAAEHDELTGLPNRAYLKKSVEQLIAQEDQLFS
ncbi:MAG: hypothetical protein ACR2I0_14870, partial [Rhodoferax sp.]